MLVLSWCQTSIGVSNLHACAMLVQVEIIANDQGNRITPSYVAFSDAERLVGDAAKNQAFILTRFLVVFIQEAFMLCYGCQQIYIAVLRVSPTKSFQSMQLSLTLLHKNFKT